MPGLTGALSDCRDAVRELTACVLDLGDQVDLGESADGLVDSACAAQAGETVDERCSCHCACHFTVTGFTRPANWQGHLVVIAVRWRIS